MSLVFGSARCAEDGSSGWNGKAKAGDSKQVTSPDYKGEVSMQAFYNHSKGWNVFRFKNADYAEQAAKQTAAACNNANIGYDQSQRLTLINYVKEHNIKDLSKVAEKVECDCSALMRVVIYVVTGKDPGAFATAGQKVVLEKTGLFENTFKYSTGTTLYNGDILCTCSSGHTGMIVSGNPRKATANQTKTEASENTSDIKVGDKVLTTALQLNVRKGAGTGYEVLGTLNKDHQVTVRAISGNWIKVFCYLDNVEDRTAVTGWISSKYVKPI